MSNLHPVFSFMDNKKHCKQAQGGKVIISAALVQKSLSCWDQCMAGNVAYGRQLRDAVDTMARVGLQDVQFMKPTVTDLVFFVQENDVPILFRELDGVRLGQVLPALVFALKTSLELRRRFIEASGPTPRSFHRISRTRRSTTEECYLIPTKEAHAAFLSLWPEILRRFEVEVYGEIHKIMNGIEAWEWTSWPDDFASHNSDISRP